ncbi:MULTISPECIES: polyamine aminopropyltransferase [unclassified Clostridioides]|uniref:polyamine aminopropyltransferase n=1 Tax=unclassified Clostridioides TaxID=2635829 RepID=UPI0006BC010A|nr:spermidine synthase [Clostridioides difficile]MCC0693122.1 polyamine aminopropyltransferase [Clostridioides sp. ZZV14-6387]MDB3083762.1 polyamine aminopropyltransferase [Clostridioides difficile]MDI0267605.1 polyamine aminopropyltransferase [Clostridioides difficile]MDI7816065.1 polyamine aminopropyltransferase [Clostridioides difficile]
MELWYTEEWTENVRFSIKVNKHLFEGKSQFQRIDVFDSDEFGKFLTIDGLMMVTDKDEFIYHEMITHVPMSTNLNIKKVLVIGGGDGGTVRELSRYPQIEKIDMVEIDKMVVDVSKEYMDICSCKLDDERVNLYFEDGVNFVKCASDKSYDLIIVDSTDPIGPGEGLFSTDFYRDCHRILSDDGILVNQSESPYFDFNAREMKRANKKLKEIFPISEVYQAHIPTYPSGHWLFGFASKKFSPIENQDRDGWEKLNLKTKYYNSNIHLGSFMLPQYVKEMLDEQ